MPGIRLRDGEPIDGALKKLKRQIEKAGIISDLKRREAYEKPSVAKKRKLAAARKKALKKLRRMTLS